MIRLVPRTMRMTVAGCAFFLLALVPCLAEAQTLNLAWDASPTANISGYYIYAGTSTGNYNVLSQVVVPAGQTTYAFQATPGVKYFFAVSAFLADGTESSRAGEVIGGIPTLTQPANASGTVGTAITAVQLGGNDPDGGTLAYSAAGLPPGLSLNTATGRITGTPTTAG